MSSIHVAPFGVLRLLVLATTGFHPWLQHAVPLGLLPPNWKAGIPFRQTRDPRSVHHVRFDVSGSDPVCLRHLDVAVCRRVLDNLGHSAADHGVDRRPDSANRVACVDAFFTDRRKPIRKFLLVRDLGTWSRSVDGGFD